METNDSSKISSCDMEELQAKIEDLKSELLTIKKTVQTDDSYSSEFINEFAVAFSKAQSEYSPVESNRQNPFFKSQYADLDAILRAVRTSLAKHGLAFYQFTKLSQGPTVLHTRLIHSSGQWIETRSRIIPPKNDQQSYGSTLSYQRRYSAMSILGITTSNEISDDDGEVLMSNRR